MSEVDLDAVKSTLATFRTETSAACRAERPVLVGHKTVARLTGILSALAAETGRPLATPPQGVLLTLADLRPYLPAAETALATLPRLRAHRKFLERLARHEPFRE